MTVRRQSNVRTGTSTLFGRAAIYARISLDKPGEAAGVGRQIESCRHLAELEGWNVDEVLVDNDLSAYSGACRPEYERLLVRFPDGVEWAYSACPPQVWAEFTAPSQSRGAFIAQVLDHKPNRRWTT